MICESCTKEHDGGYGSGRFCCQGCARSFATKVNRKEINKKISEKLKGKKLSPDVIEKIRITKLANKDKISHNISVGMKRYYKRHPEAKKKISDRMTGRIVSTKTRLKLSELAKKNELGGHNSKLRLYYTQKDGNVVYLHSSYEKIVAESLDKYDIRWTRPKYLKYINETGEHRYYPDFYLSNYNVYLDPKNNYLIKKDKEKIRLVCEQNDVQVIVLDRHNLLWCNIKQLIGGLAQLGER